MKNESLEIIDRVDDLVYEYFKESDNSFLKEKPEYRFLLLSSLFSTLCPFNLANNNISLGILNEANSIKPATLKKAEQVCNIIYKLIGNPTYFAASYWSPIDRDRHTISHSNLKNGNSFYLFHKANALLFYLLTRKAPPTFHSAINYISENAIRKDGLHSTYIQNYIESESQNHSWFHIPKTIHDEMLEVSGFNKAVSEILNLGKVTIENSLTVIMENLDFDKREREISKYFSIINEIFYQFENFNVPPNLKTYSLKFQEYLNTFLFSSEIDLSNVQIFSEKQAFYMACTHVLYNKACPTEMFYAFPVRVDDTCCFFTLGVENELSLNQILVFSHFIKSIYHHSLDRDYQSLKAIERNRIAHGAVHKIRGPLNFLSEFPFTILEMLEANLSKDEFSKIQKGIKDANESFNNSLDNINIGLKSLEKFIDIEEEGLFDLHRVIKNAVDTYLKLNIKVLESIEIQNRTDTKINIFGIDSQIQFIFEELISNSIRAFKHFNRVESKKLKIVIQIGEEKDNFTVDFFDNGVGVENFKKNMIFSSGFRGKDSGGSGKGLFLSKLFLNRYKNDIYECGEYNKGAHFRIKFYKNL